MRIIHLDIHLDGRSGRRTIVALLLQCLVSFSFSLYVACTFCFDLASASSDLAHFFDPVATPRPLRISLALLELLPLPNLIAPCIAQAAHSLMASCSTGSKQAPQHCIPPSVFALSPTKASVPSL